MEVVVLAMKFSNNIKLWESPGCSEMNSNSTVETDYTSILISTAERESSKQIEILI